MTEQNHFYKKTDQVTRCDHSSRNIFAIKILPAALCFFAMASGVFAVETQDAQEAGKALKEVKPSAELKKQDKGPNEEAETNAQEGRERIDGEKRPPQKSGLPGHVFVGLDGGAVLPLGEFTDFFQTGWACGLDLEYETDLTFLAVHAKGGCYSFSSGEFPNYFFPLYATVALKTPWTLPVPIKAYAFGGGGIIWEFITINGEGKSNYDPLIVGGAGIEYLFTLGDLVFGPYLEGAYHFIYQKSQMEAKYNGKLVQISLGLKLHVL
jgi:hypothetical protein